MIATLVGLAALLAVAWLSAASAAVRSVSRIWLRHWVEQQLQGAVRGEPYLDRPQSLLAISAVGIAMAVGVLGATLGASAAEPGLHLVVGLGCWGMALLALGQMIPRAVGRHWAMQLAPVLLPPLRALERAVGRLAAGPRDAGAAEHSGSTASRARIEDLLREGELEGIGAQGEIAIITGVLDFGAKLVGDVMTKREDVFTLSANTPPRDLAAAIAASGYSRVPITGAGIDDITGMVHVFDVLKAGGTRTPPLRAVAFATGTHRCSDLLVEMQRRRLHLAVVRDAENRTVGIVTLEDLLEELVGDISDEHDDVPAVAASAGTAGA